MQRSFQRLDPQSIRLMLTTPIQLISSHGLWSPTSVPSCTFVTILGIQKVTQLPVKLLIMMVIIILKTNHIVDSDCSGTMVKRHVLTNTSKLIGGICDKVVEVGVLGSHMFLNQSKVLSQREKSQSRHHILFIHKKYEK